MNAVSSNKKNKKTKFVVKKIRKRDGKIVKYNKQRIIDAVYRALIVSNKKSLEENKQLAQQVADAVEEKLIEIYENVNRHPQVEEIQDLVEATLLEAKLFKALKQYVNYRQVRRFIREEKKAVLNKRELTSLEKKMTLTAIQILEARYLIKNKKGKVVESIDHLFKRSAVVAVLSDIVFDNKVVDVSKLYTVKNGIRHDYKSPKATVRDLDHKVKDKEVKSFLKTIRPKLKQIPDVIEDLYTGYFIGKFPLLYGHMERIAFLYDEVKQVAPDAVKISFNKLLDLLSKKYFDKLEVQISKYYQMLTDRDFLPNSPTLMNAGHRLGQLSACFVLDIEDDLKQILLTAAHVGIVFQSGGGVGINYGKLRPGGDVVSSTNGIASGPLSFMRIIETVTDVVKQGGRRRGANMGVLDVFHPNIEEFITVKEDLQNFTNFNLSVGFWESFFEALREKKPYGLINPRTKEIVKTIDPDFLLEQVAQSAWKSAEPGCLFFDNMNKYNVLLKAKGHIRATNPCGEQPLYAYESCNLGSIDLAKCVVEKDGKKFFDWKKYYRLIRLSTRFLDGIIDINNYPLPLIRRTTRGGRKIGLGIMGAADALYKLGLPYNSKEAYELMERWAEDLSYYSMLESVKLAQEKSAFSFFDKTDYVKGQVPVAGVYDSRQKYRDWDNLVELIKQHGIRNSMTTTLAPTGSISMIADTSSGLEPQFALVYKKNIAVGSFYVVDPAFREYLTFAKRDETVLKELVANNYGRLEGLDEHFTKEEQERFITAQEIHWIDHIFAQFVWQRWVSASISKTINMPNHVTHHDIKHAYLLGHELGLKGLTIFRDGSRTGVIEIAGERKQKKATPTKYVIEYVDKLTEKSDIYSSREDYRQGLLQILQDANGQDVVSPSEVNLKAFESGEETEALKDKAVGVKIKKNIQTEDTGRQFVEPENSDACPVCGSTRIVHESGCEKCLDCGWSACSVS